MGVRRLNWNGSDAESRIEVRQAVLVGLRFEKGRSLPPLERKVLAQAVVVIEGVDCFGQSIDVGRIDEKGRPCADFWQ